jgi:hypothetical protein
MVLDESAQDRALCSPRIYHRGLVVEGGLTGIFARLHDDDDDDDANA